MVEKKEKVSSGGIRIKVSSIVKLGQWLVAEGAFFGLLYYVQMLLKVEGNLWISTLIIFVLSQVAMYWCPMMKRK